MAKSIYGFAEQSSGGSSSGKLATTAIRLYNKTVAQLEAEGGLLTPDIIEKARNTYLEPYIDDVRVADAYYDSINRQREIQDKIADSKRSAVTKETELQEKTIQAVRENKSNLAATLTAVTYEYVKAVDDALVEIERRKLEGGSTDGLQEFVNKNRGKVATLVSANRQILTTGKLDNTNAIGWVVQTNPVDGSIVSMNLEVLDSLNNQPGFKATNATYQGLPIFANTFKNDKGEEVAKIGLSDFKFNEDEKVLEMQGRRGWLSKLFSGTSAEADEVSSANQGDVQARTLNLSSIPTWNIPSLPAGAVARSTRGHYFYFGSDGTPYVAENKEVLTDYLRSIGQLSTDNIDNQAFTVSLPEASVIVSAATKEDGTTRRIDRSMLQGLQTQAPTDNLPARNQAAKSSLTVLPGGLQGPPVPPGLVPRKDPGQQAPAQSTGGQYSVPDVIKTEGEKIKQLFVDPFRRLLNR